MLIKYNLKYTNLDEVVNMCMEFCKKNKINVLTNAVKTYLIKDIPIQIIRFITTKW